MGVHSGDLKPVDVLTGVLGRRQVLPLQVRCRKVSNLRLPCALAGPVTVQACPLILSPSRVLPLTRADSGELSALVQTQ